MFMESPANAAWGAVFSALALAACVMDVRSRRIPNWLVLIIAAGGLGYSLAARPPVLALRSSGGGLLLGFAIWIVFYIVGAMGAGDVKFFSAVGAWLGPSLTWRAAVIAALIGGVLAVFFLVQERRFKSALTRMTLAASSRSLDLVTEPEDGAKTRKHLPYGVAMAAGALVAAWWPQLLHG